jgi:hypothetical protein
MVTIGMASISIPFIDLGNNLVAVFTCVHGKFIYILYIHWKFYGHFNFVDLLSDLCWNMLNL